MDNLVRITPDLRFAKVREVKTPERGTTHSAGLDFFVPTLWNNGISIETGIHIDLMGSGLKNYILQFNNKSGVAVKRGLVVGACIIDADYQGELIIDIHNISNKIQIIEPGTKIAQGILVEVLYSNLEEHEFNQLYKSKTERGEGRFGSTGDR